MIFTPPPPEFGAPAKFHSWRDGQDKLFWDVLDSKFRFSIHNAPVGCHATGTRILLSDGFTKLVEEICVGDSIAGPDGSPRYVKSVHNGSEWMFRIIPTSGGEPFDVTHEHVLHLIQTQQGVNISKRKYRHSFEERQKDVQLKNYLTASKNFKREHKLLRAGEVIFEDTNTDRRSIDPYILGLLLGDGCMKYSGSVNVTTADSEIVESLYAYTGSRGMRMHQSKPKKNADGSYNKALTYSLICAVNGNRWNRNPLISDLRALGLFGRDSGSKFIPHAYKMASIVERYKLLAGLIDTDGSQYSNCFEYCTKSDDLARDFLFIARSLGFKCNAGEKIIDGVRYNRIGLSGHTDRIPTRIKRKQAAPRKQKKDPRVSGFEIEALGKKPYYGFEVDGDHLYLTADFTIHHNCGKSLSYMTAALATGKRVAFLTESKGLQDQLHADFGGVAVAGSPDLFGPQNLFDMRGLQNYTCQAMAPGGELEDMWQKRWGRPTCDVGPCTAGLRCDLKDEGCDYYDDYRRSRSAQLVSTNYAYWIAIHKYGEGLGAFDMLVLDECHSADSQLSSALSVEFNAKDLRELRSHPPKNKDLQQWRMWGRVQLQRVLGKLDFYTKGAKVGCVGESGAAQLVRDTDVPDASELKFWKKLEGKCKTLSDSTDDWIIETNEETGHTRIAPVWVRNYAETHMFLSVPRVVMMSATVRPKIKNLLGINEESAEFIEYPSTFPVRRRPIYWIPTVKLNYSSTKEDLRTWVVRIDQILARRLDRKGIIHTISYDRQRFLIENSRFRSIMIWNAAGNTKDVVQSFREAKAPAVLVSPSVGTGFDFPDDFARYQIIGKVPFRDMRGEILKAQSVEDPDYLNYLTAQDLIQMYGRSNRAPSDFSETIVVDDSIEWFLDRYSGYRYDKDAGRFDMNTRRLNSKNFFPYYFLEAFTRVNGVPDPPTLESIAC